MLDGCNLCLKLEVPGLIKSMDLLVSIFANFIDFAGPLLVFISNFLFEVFDGLVVVIFVMVMLDDEMGFLFCMIFFHFFEIEIAISQLDSEFPHFF